MNAVSIIVKATIMTVLTLLLIRFSDIFYKKICGNFSYHHFEAPFLELSHSDWQSKRVVESRQTNDFETAHPCSIKPNNEILACGLHHFFGDDRQLIGDRHLFDLLHQAVN